VDFDETDQILIRYSAFDRERSRTVHQLFTDFEKVYDSVRSEV
jgi:hypothetical protein